MKQIPCYERAPYRTELEVEVLEVRRDGASRWAVLDDTILYPGGGGQPCDHGWLNGVKIDRVERREERILHFLCGGEVEKGPALLRLDWVRRYDHMQQHTAQHLLSAAALEMFDWKTRAFHLGEELCDIDLAVGAPSSEEIEALEDRVLAQVAAARRVASRRVTCEQYSEMEVRSRGLPAGHAGEIRLVEIDGVDLNTCGGTHVGLTSEVGAVKILKVEPQRGGSRLTWLAGGRLRRRIARHEARNAELRRLLDTGDEELVTACRLKADQLAAARRRQRLLEERLTELLVSRMLDSDDSLLEHHLTGPEAGLLRRMAEELGGRAAGRVALLTAEGDDGALFALVAGEGVDLDLAEIGFRVGEILGGRGGGSGRVFQGKASSLSRREEAVAAVRQALQRLS